MKRSELLAAGLGLILLALLPSACSDFRFSVNDRVVYTPEPLFEDYTIVDENLRACVEQAIRGRHIIAAGQLDELNCGHAGIIGLQGIEVFTGLLRLKLSGNSIRKPDSLFHLQMLEELQLDDNELTSLKGIGGLLELSYLKLLGNRNLPCRELAYLAQRDSLKLEAPAHCRGLSP